MVGRKKFVAMTVMKRFKVKSRRKRVKCTKIEGDDIQERRKREEIHKRMGRK